MISVDEDVEEQRGGLLLSHGRRGADFTPIYFHVRVRQQHIHPHRDDGEADLDLFGRKKIFRITRVIFW